MDAKIIELFNHIYHLYLNGVLSSTLIPQFIDTSMKLFNLKNIFYYSYSNNKHYNSFPVIFSSKQLGYFNIDDNFLKFINSNKTIKQSFELFINYLAILSYNFKAIKQVEILECGIFNKILHNLEEGIIITNNINELSFLNLSAKMLIKDLNNFDNFDNFNNNTEYLNKNITIYFKNLDEYLKEEKIFKNRVINIKIDMIELQFLVNSIIFNDIFYNIFIIKQLNINTFPSNTKNITAFLSHELRNPLQTITLANHLIQEKHNDQILSKYLNMINKASYDMKKIINDILDASKIDLNEIILEIENVNINELILEVKESINPLIQNNLIQISDEIHEDVPTEIMSDSTRLKQILINLLSNAIKYSKQNKENMILIKVEYVQSTNSISFSISDTGIGIKVKDLIQLDNLLTNNLFDNLNKNDNIVTPPNTPIVSPNRTSSRRSSISDSFIFADKNKNSYDSNGLGLYICNKIATLLGGTINIKSELNIGSTFTFIHPIQLGNSGILYKNRENLNLKGKILVVDDSNNNTYLFKIILDNFNFKYNSIIETEIVNSGETAIDLCKVNQYDLIFMDINMIGIDGYTTSKLIRQYLENVIIIATTGNINVNIYNVFNDILLKPFNDKDILKILKQYLK